MKYGSVCSGIEAATSAWHPLGWTPVFFSEIEAFPNAVLKHHYPNVPNYGDMTKFKEWPHDSIDLLVGGTPCFVGGTLILTRNGLVPIECVAVGDLVLTHQNRWKSVLRTGKKTSRTTKLKGQGGVIRTTSEHLFLSIGKEKVWDNTNRAYRKVLSDPVWVEARRMKGRMWATPVSIPHEEPTAIKAIGNEHEAPPFSEAFFRVVGMWIGNGWTRINRRRSYAIICDGDEDADEMEEAIRAAGFHSNRSKERTAIRFQIGSSAFAKWLRKEFGSGSHGKSMPTWALSMRREWRQALLDGLIFTDGCITKNGFRITTVSRRLALSISLLVASLGKSSSTTLSDRPKTHVIEGRIVNQRPFYVISIYHQARSSVQSDGFRWGLVRAVEDTDKVETVYDLEVEEDHSYVADGFVVHNCQSFSVAGLRKGMADPRGNLALVFLAIVDRLRPQWVVWENVPGVLSSTSHDAPDPRPPEAPLDVGCKGQEMETEDEYDSEELHAFNCFLAGLSELGYGWSYRILDAQFFGVPQRRRRPFVVGYLGDWRRAAAVLFERHSLQGDPTPSREARKGTPAGVAHSLRGRSNDSHREDSATYIPEISPAIKSRDYKGPSSDGDGDGATLIAPCLRSNPYNNSDPGMESQMLVSHPLKAEGHDASEDGTGRGVPLVVGTVGRSHGQPRIDGGVPVIPIHGDGIPISESPIQVADTLRNHPRPGSNSLGAIVGVNMQGNKSSAGSFTDVSPTLNGMHGHDVHAIAAPMILHENQSGNASVDDKAKALKANASHSYQVVAAPITASYGKQIDSSDSSKGPPNLIVAAPLSAGSNPNSNAAGRRREDDENLVISVDLQNVALGSDIAGTLDTTRPSRGGGQAVAFNNRQDPSHPLAAGANASAIALQMDATPKAGGDLAFTMRQPSPSGGGNPPTVAVQESQTGCREYDTAGSLRANGPGHDPVGTRVRSAMSVRRLTPAECEALQGFPSGYTLVPFRGKPAHDGPRYKALGNSMAVPVMRWIGKRIDAVSAVQPIPGLPSQAAPVKP